MYLEYETQLGEDGEITISVNTDKTPYPITLTLSNGSDKIEIRNIEPHKLGQFVVNTRRILTMAHENDLLENDEELDLDDEDD